MKPCDPASTCKCPHVHNRGLHKQTESSSLRTHRLGPRAHKELKASTVQPLYVHSTEVNKGLAHSYSQQKPLAIVMAMSAWYLSLFRCVVNNASVLQHKTSTYFLPTFPSSHRRGSATNYGRGMSGRGNRAQI